MFFWKYVMLLLLTSAIESVTSSLKSSADTGAKTVALPAPSSTSPQVICLSQPQSTPTPVNIIQLPSQQSSIPAPAVNIIPIPQQQIKDSNKNLHAFKAFVSGMVGTVGIAGIALGAVVIGGVLTVSFPALIGVLGVGAAALVVLTTIAAFA